MFHYFALVRYIANRPRRPVLFLAIAPCLFLLGTPSSLSAQSCTLNTTTSCDATINPGACGRCVGNALVDIMACDITGICNPDQICEDYNLCLASMPPTPPSAPTPPSSPPLVCGPQVEVRNPVPLSRRLGTLSATPLAAASGSCEIKFVDPVPDLQSGNEIKQDPGVLGVLGRSVSAIAADGAARVVLRIGTGNASDVTLTLLDESGVTRPPEMLGSLSSVGGAENSSSVNVKAVSAPGGPMAFAVYRAPFNFSRGAPYSDDTATDRTVSVQATLPDGTTFTSPLKVLRPPLVLVHGIWGDTSDWDTFTPLISDGRFFVRYADYNRAPEQLIVTASVPSYTRDVLASVRGNALGLDFGAPRVLWRIWQTIMEFQSIKNAAATQVDVITHSMGGTVSRTAVNLPGFAMSDSFGAGYIHKLITIGTPHLGSPLARDLLADNACLRNELAVKRHIALDTATLGAALNVSGGAGDLRPGSPALGRIQNGSLTVPTALIAATTLPANLASLDTGMVGQHFRNTCPNDPVAQRMTAQLWQTEFGEDNDGVVAASSQLATFSPTPATNPVHGVIHSAGLEGGWWGPFYLHWFTGPAELDAASSVAGIQELVILFLNEKPSGPDFHPLN